VHDELINVLIVLVNLSNQLFCNAAKKNTMTLNDNHSIILIIKNVVFLPDLYIYAVFVKILSVCKNYCLLNT